MKVYVFADIEWSVGRVHRDIARQLPDIEFTYDHWANYDWETVCRKFNECDVCLTNVVCLRFFRECFSHFDFKKCIFLSHGFEDNQSTNIDDMKTDFVYGMTSTSIEPLFPPNVKLFLMPNGVEPAKFDYILRDGTISSVGWCGAPNVWYKQAWWAVDIANKSGIPIRISSGVPCESDLDKWTPLNYDQLCSWYSTIDLLLITSIPDNEKHETGPLPAFEAIASGVPVIGTAVGNFKNVPGPKFKTVEEGVEIVNMLMSDPEKMKELASQQYEYVMNNFTYASFANKWRDAFEYVYLKNRRE